MNLTNVKSVIINNKTVKNILLNGRKVYEQIQMTLSANKEYILTDETVTVNLESELIEKEVELFKVINMTRTSMGTETTDENGQATWTYTGTGAGDVKFVAVYDNKESNTVTVDDYIPVPVLTPSATSISTIYGNSMEWSVTVKDQHGEVMVGETVSFYDGNTYLSSDTTNSNGIAYISLSTFDVGEYTLTAHLDGIISQSCAVTISKANTWLGIDTPLLVYSDMFDVNGTLKRSNSSGNGVVGETVTLHWKIGSGVEQTATTETTTGGAFNFHKGPVATMSPYKFWITYSGSNNYNGSNSSEVDVNPVKESTVLNITSPAPEQIVSNTILVTGTLKDNDGTAMSGESVSFSLNDVSQGTATVGSDGGFSKTLTGLVMGSNEISASFASTATHSGSAHTIEVVCSSFDGLSDLSLIDGSQILSYADEQQDPYTQYAALETQLMNGDSPAAISGISVGFYDYSDENNPVLLGSDDTDSAGKASFTYYSTGAGDVPVKAKVGSLLTKTFVVSDIIKYDATEHTYTSAQTDTYPYQNQVYSLPSHYKMQFKLKNNTNYSGAGVLRLLLHPSSDTVSWNLFWFDFFFFLLNFLNFFCIFFAGFYFWSFINIILSYI